MCKGCSKLDNNIEIIKKPLKLKIRVPKPSLEVFWRFANHLSKKNLLKIYSQRDNLSTSNDQHDVSKWLEFLFD
jgi:hypothetical protein